MNQLKRWQLAAYGAPALPLSMATLPLAVYLPAVYADSEGFGLGFAFVSIVFMSSRIFDGVTDPFVGFYSDKIRTRFGRRKPFVVIGTPIYIIGLCLLWMPPFDFYETTALGVTFNIGYLYLLGALVLLYVGSTIKDVPYSAWGAELSQSYNERTLITSWREGFTVTGSLVAAFLPVVLLGFGYGKPTEVVQVLAILVAIVMPVLVLIMVVVVPEHPVVEQRKERIPIMESLSYVWANLPYRRLVIIFLFSTIGSALTNTLSFFFVKHVLLAGDLYGYYLAPYFVSQVIAIPLWFKLSRRIGKHRATMVAIGWYSLWSCFIPLIAIAPQAWFSAFEMKDLATILPQSMENAVVGQFEGMETGKFLFFIGVMCLKGSSIGALSALPYAMAADVVDIDVAQTGKRRGGAYFSIWTMTRKLAYALGLGVGALAIVWINFDSLADPLNTTNTAETLLWVACLYSVIPALFKFVAMPLLWNYPLTEAKLAEIQREIARKIDTAQTAEETSATLTRGPA